MQESFYHFILKERDPNRSDSITNLAYNIAGDGMFPKTSTSYTEISSYLEMNGDYVTEMTVFDQAWDKYLDLKS